ncbi:glycosyltransferase family 4 protein [Mesorhizobium sp. AR02]|uniref:glycosyltransferase family 4 protein n=1 Tax=Mesorhizobium sp. AR02 TaxID=2865837 RepID=UPI00215EE553|nr:glycosyltransferase family 4 protein [Mesorhizobium sp. AR02]UVK53906.1 glycosyltransferase family 4 protein [Mesorhizobium sp. AR02]
MTFEQPLTVLIANIYLTGRSGTEIVTREVAFALMRAGHRPIVYAPGLGPIAEEIQARGIPVTDDISTIAADIDIIHGNHTQVTAIATARFPNAPALYFAHDFVAWHSAPPLLANVCKYVAVDDTVAERLQFEAGIPADRIVTLLNAVDTDRFAPGPPLPERPRRALAFAKNTQHLHAVRAACAERGIELDVIGASIGSIVSEPETLLPQYDLVFASALSALEAMACGRAVIVCDGRGLAGMARSDTWDGWRRRNFGLRVLQQRLSPEAIAAEIDRYDAVDAAEISSRTRQEASMSKWSNACLLLYREAIGQHRAKPASKDELNLSLARHMQTWLPKPGPIWPWMTEREDLRAQLARVQAELELAELAQAELAQAELEQVELEPAGPDQAGLEPVGLEPVEANKVVSFAQADDPERFVHLTGFSAVEHWGVWTDGDLATVEFKISSAAAPTSLRLGLVPFLHENHPEVIAELFINGMWIERRVFGPTAPGAPLFLQQDWQVALPPEAALARSLAVSLRIENPASPLQVGLSDDRRRLGLGLCLIELGE